MNKKEFIDYIKELENFYGQPLNDTEREVWFENLKFMTIQRFNYIIAEVYKTNKFMPKLSEILAIHKSIPYTAMQEQVKAKGNCPKCGNAGYVIYTKLVDGHSYQFTAVCDCGRQQRYDGRQCADAKNQSDYYIPTITEIGIEVKDNKPTKQQVYESMLKLKNSQILPESIRNIIRQEFIKMRS